MISADVVNLLGQAPVRPGLAFLSRSSRRVVERLGWRTPIRLKAEAVLDMVEAVTCGSFIESRTMDDVLLAAGLPRGEGGEILAVDEVGGLPTGVAAKAALAVGELGRSATAVAKVLDAADRSGGNLHYLERGGIGSYYHSAIACWSNIQDALGPPRVSRSPNRIPFDVSEPGLPERYIERDIKVLRSMKDNAGNRPNSWLGWPINLGPDGPFGLFSHGPQARWPSLEPKARRVDLPEVRSSKERPPDSIQLPEVISLVVPESMSDDEALNLIRSYVRAKATERIIPIVVVWAPQATTVTQARMVAAGAMVWGIGDRQSSESYTDEEFRLQVSNMFRRLDEERPFYPAISPESDRLRWTDVFAIDRLINAPSGVGEYPFLRPKAVRSRAGNSLREKERAPSKFSRSRLARENEVLQELFLSLKEKADADCD